MLTQTFPLTVDGYRLDTLAYNISTYEGRRGVPGRRLGAAEVPGVHGVIPALSNNSLEPTEYVLKMWVAGAGENGIRPDSGPSRLYYDRNLDMLFHLFGKLDRLLDIRQTMGDGSVRQVHGRVAEALTPTVMGMESAILGEFTVVLQLPYVFWQDVEPQVFSGPASATAPHTLRVDTLTGSTAPIEDALFLVHGPAASGVTLTCPDTGGWISLHRPLAVGEVWRVDSAKWLSQVGPIGMGFDGPADTDVIAHTEFAGSGARLLSLQPVVKMPPDYVPGDTYSADSAAHRVVDVTLSGGGFSSATRVQIRARRKFL